MSLNLKLAVLSLHRAGDELLTRKERVMNLDDLLNVEDLEIEPITDEILSSVLGGLGEDDGFFAPSCSKSGCSNQPTTISPSSP